MRRDKWLYVFLILPVAYFIIFRYTPMYGVIIAFKDYRIVRGIFGSEWVGLAHFQRLFNTPDFYKILRNSLLLNIYGLVLGWPAPIILALLLNEVKQPLFKRVSQSILYLPYFISWVVLAGIFIQLLSPSTGIVNIALRALGFQPIFFMTHNVWWVISFLFSGIWAGAGWGSIIYLAAISAIDPELYEASWIDGANKLTQMWHITLPGIKATISILLILRLGGMLDVGFEHIYNMMNPAVFDVSDVFATYVFRVGIQNAQFSFTTAVGLFQSVVSLILIITANKITRMLGENSLW